MAKIEIKIEMTDDHGVSKSFGFGLERATFQEFDRVQKAIDEEIERVVWDKGDNKIEKKQAI